MLPHNALPARTITVSDLAVKRGERVLFEGLGFVVTPGELLLLRGPNGTGKTTLLLALAGIIRPVSGHIGFSGADADQREGTDLHLLAHFSAIKARLSVAENLAFWAAVNGGAEALIGPSLETVGLAGLARLDAGHLSAGQSRRLALARLLVADRPIWLMDEPTAALDAGGEILVARLIKAHLMRGGVAIAATHHDIAVPPPANIKTLMLGATP